MMKKCDFLERVIDSKIYYFLFFMAFIVNSPLFMNKLYAFISRPESLKLKVLNIAVFLALNAFSLLFLVLVPYFSRGLRFLALLVVFVGGVFYLSFYYSTGTAMGFYDYISLVYSAGSIDSAFSVYYVFVLKAVFVVGVLCLLLLLRSRSMCFPWEKMVFLISFLLPVLAGSGIIYAKKTGYGLEGMPAYMIPYSYLFAEQLNAAMAGEKMERQLPSSTAFGKGVKNIVLIVDESVRSDMISEQVTPDYRGLKKMLNFGVASSYSNCSQYSNILLRKMPRFGMEVSDVNADPFVWDLMKQAGYSSILMDAQMDGKGHNFFTSQELADVDVVSVKNFEDDRSLAENILEKLNGEGKKFIYVLKKGAHFPYSFKKDFEKFSPVMQSNVIAFEDEDKVLNSYKNSIYFNTNEFFKVLKNSGDDTVFIYTSDHGQNLKNLNKRQTHCSVENPLPDEGRVPLMVFGEYNDYYDKIAAYLDKKASHYLIPFFLMHFSGYSDGDIDAFLGKPPEMQSFVYGNVKGFFGGKPYRLNLEELHSEVLQMGNQ